MPHAADVKKLGDDAEYRALFKKSFGTPDVTIARVEAAIASLKRTALTGNSAFDRYQYGGDKNALTAAQLRGYMVYLNPNGGNCASCHTIGPQGALFTDGKFHNTGEALRMKATSAMWPLPRDEGLHGQGSVQDANAAQRGENCTIHA